MRIIFNTRYTEQTNNYFMELNALKLFIFFMIYKAGLFMCEANKNLLPIGIHLFVHMYGHMHTRQTGNFQQLNVSTTKKQVCFYRRAKVAEFP